MISRSLAWSAADAANKQLKHFVSLFERLAVATSPLDSKEAPLREVTKEKKKNVQQEKKVWIS